VMNPASAQSRQMFARGLAVMMAMLAATAVVLAEPYDPKAIFYSDAVLRAALENIAQMQEPELRAFTHYLAECQDEMTNAQGKHACVAAQTTYEIEFGDKRALDSMIIARSIIVQVPPDVNDRVNLVEAARAKAQVLVALERAVSSRFRALKASRK
jgi:hypothetical protein